MLTYNVTRKRSKQILIAVLVLILPPSVSLTGFKVVLFNLPSILFMGALFCQEHNYYSHFGEGIVKFHELLNLL